MNVCTGNNSRNQQKLSNDLSITVHSFKILQVFACFCNSNEENEKEFSELFANLSPQPNIKPPRVNFKFNFHRKKLEELLFIFLKIPKNSDSINYQKKHPSLKKPIEFPHTNFPPPAPVFSIFTDFSSTFSVFILLRFKFRQKLFFKQKQSRVN